MNCLIFDMNYIICVYLNKLKFVKLSDLIMKLFVLFLFLL